MVVNITRPHFIGHVAVVIVSVFVTLLIIPNQFANQLILSLAFVIGETLIITLNLQVPVIQTAFSILLSMFLATAIGISSSWQFIPGADGNSWPVWKNKGFWKSCAGTGNGSRSRLAVSAMA